MDIDAMIAFEEGSLSLEETIALFQQMIDDGSVWTLQGFYGRTASQLIENGHCMLGLVPYLDAYGNVVPSRYDVDADTPGSASFVKRCRDVETV